MLNQFAYYLVSFINITIFCWCYYFPIFYLFCFLCTYCSFFSQCAFIVKYSGFCWSSPPFQTLQSTYTAPLACVTIIYWPCSHFLSQCHRRAYHLLHFLCIPDLQLSMRISPLMSVIFPILCPHGSSLSSFFFSLLLYLQPS